MQGSKFRNTLTFSLILTFSAVIYWLTKAGYVHLNYYVPLADAWLHGRLNILNPPSWLNELALEGGKYYVVYPPMPAVLLLPAVALFGPTFDQGVLSIILGAASMALTWVLLSRLGVGKEVSIWLTVLFGFGTCFWFVVVTGTAWYLAHVSAVFFLTLAIIETFGKKRELLVGLLVGFATLSRLPVVLSYAFFALMLGESKEPRITLRRLTLLTLGLAIPLGFNAAYNFARYATPFDVGYFKIPGLFEEPFTEYGLFNIRYIPRHIYAIVFQGPIFLNTFPYFKPSMMGLGLFFTTPAFLYAFAAPSDRVGSAAKKATVLILIPLLTHAGIGFTQFGYRYSLDFTPFLVMLTAKAMDSSFNRTKKIAIILSILINMWGVISIVKYSFWSY